MTCKYIGFFSFLIFFSYACGGAQSSLQNSEFSNRSLESSEAIDSILRLLSEENIQVEKNWEMRIDYAEKVRIDLHLIGTELGIEWFTELERESHPERFPMPSKDQLRIIPGVQENRRAEVLLLDAQIYVYTTDPAQLHRGVPGRNEIEARLRRDIRDFIAYARSQGKIE